MLEMAAGLGHRGGGTATPWGGGFIDFFTRELAAPLRALTPA